MLIIKKLLSLFLVLILILALIYGCSAPTNDTLTQVENQNPVEIIETATPQVKETLIQIEETLTQIEESKAGNSTEEPAKTVTPQATKIPSKPATNAPDNTTRNLLTVSYIDVGQGDSILIQSPNGKNMLIDAGDSSSESTVYNYLNDKGVKKIDVLVATHPHADHIGGMAYIIDNFDVGLIYMPRATTTTKTFENLLNTIKGKGLSISTAKAGVVINLDSALNINMIAPVGTSYSDLNSYSAVIKITYKNNSFVFVGDANNTSEQEILNSGADIKADVLKVGHHGSATSTSSAFLQAVSPQYAIISVGQGNSYGHPTQATLERLNVVVAKVYRTDIGGTVVITSNGQNIKVNRGATTYNSQAPPPKTPVKVVAVKTPAPSAVANTKDVNVFKTRTGKKYHLDGCSSLSKSKIPIQLSEAKAEGLGACARCHPPQ